MEKLLELLKDGNARTVEMLASQLQTSVPDILRQLEYLEHIGAIWRVSFTHGNCHGCAGCASMEPGSSSGCKGCMPKDGFQNMGEMWEVTI